MRLGRHNSFDDSGAIALIVAILAVVLLGISALVVDAGVALETRRDAQKTADLAALAGGQELPDQAAARTVVAQYLADNGWPLPAGDVQTLLNDDDFANGEVDFDPGLNANGLANTSLTVYPPTRSVGFLLSGVFNTLSGPKSPTGVDVSAAATVEIRSVKNILPFQVPGGVDPGILCIKNDTADPCADKTEGDFGFLAFPRDDVNGLDAVLQKNIREGVQFTPTLIPDADGVLEDALAMDPDPLNCSDSPPYPDGAILIGEFDGFNCAPPGPGNKMSVVTDALVGTGGVGGCNGRLAVPSGTPGAIAIDKCFVSPDAFATYINPASDLANVNSWGPISAAIADDPRFGILPVMASANVISISGSGGDKEVPIVKFYGSYYRTFYDSSGTPFPTSTKKNIGAISAFVFPLDLIDGIAPNDVGTIPYIGGVKIPVLVK